MGRRPERLLEVLHRGRGQGQERVGQSPGQASVDSESVVEEGRGAEYPSPPLASSPRGLSRSEVNPSAKLVWFLAAAGAFLFGSNLPLSRHSALYYRLLQ